MSETKLSPLFGLPDNQPTKPAQESEQWERYETALMRFQQHVKRSEDGTLRLGAADGKSIGVDPHLIKQFKQSLEVTNAKIRKGEIDPNKVLQVHY